MSSRAFVPAALWLSMSLAVGQGPVPTLPAPREILSHFLLRDATVQDLLLPPGAGTFEVRVELGGVPHTVRFHPHEIRSTDFQLLVDDGRSVRPVPAAPSVTYQGFVLGQPESVAAGTLVQGRLSAVIRLGADLIYGIEPADQAIPGLPGSSHVVFRAHDVHLPDVRCGNHETQPRPFEGGGPAPLAMKEAEIAIDVDLEYYNRYGANTTSVQNQVTSVMNAVDAIFKRDVEITYKVTTILIRTTAIYSGTDMGSLLTQFANYWNGNHGSVRRDLAHYFTGKGSFSGVIGIAYLGVVCNVGSAYGVSKAFSSALTTNAGLVSHETGHNWNAPHCDATPPCYIMCSGLGGCGANVTLFGSVSSSTIISFKNSRTCLSDPIPPNPPVLTNVSPNTVTSFQPAEVTLTGNYFVGATKLVIGSTDVTSFNVVNTNTIKFTPPAPFAIGASTIRVVNPVGQSAQLPYTVTGNHPSVLSIPAYLPRGFPLPFRTHTDKNWRALLLLSTSNQPSVLPGVVSLNLGNGFAELFTFADLPAGADGKAELNFSVPQSVPQFLNLYWQSVTYDPANLQLPFEVSNWLLTTIF